MANTKISDLTAASALDGSELLVGVQGGANVKITTAQVKTYAISSFYNEPLLELSNWDMDATGSVNRPHGLADITKIVSWSIIVYDDSGKPFADTRGANIEVWINDIDATNVEVSRLPAGFYDSTAYNDTGVVRVAILFKLKA